MTKSNIFLFFCLFFLVGISLSSFLNFSLVALLVIFILGLILISVFWPDRRIAVIGFSLFFLAIGIWRQQSAEMEIMGNELRKLNGQESEITLVGIVANDPETREKSQQLMINQIKKEDNYFFRGKLLVLTSRYPEYHYGDQLEISGQLKSPAEDVAGFNYRNYLKKDRIYSIMSWPEIKIRGENKGKPFLTAIFSLKNRFQESLYQNLSPPQSSILGAILLGDKGRISKEWQQKLNITGVRHITAISGMNVVILAGILIWLGLLFGLRRNQAFYFTVVALIIFVIMTGLQPSAIRAGIMAGLFLYAQKIGRLNSAGRTLVYAATLMLLENPLLLRLDIGFQLSFLATAGIIYLTKPLESLLQFVPNPETFKIRELLTMTLAAQIFTLQILIYNFGYISLVAPLTNILIVPLTPCIMGFGFLFILAGVFFPFLGWLFSFPAWLLLTFLIKTVDFFSRSWAYLSFEIHWLWLVIFYLVLGCFLYETNRKRGLISSKI